MTHYSTQTRVFISYAKEDGQYARRLYDDLKLLGVTPWMDSKELLPGQDWETAIRREIEVSDFFIALISSKSLNKRGFVQKELKQAFDVLATFPEGQIYVIPARLEDCHPLDSNLTKLHWADLFESWENGLQQIALAMEIGHTFHRSPPFQTEQQIKIDFPDEGMKQLEELRDALGARSDQETILQSLRLMQWFVEARKRGETLYLEKETENKRQKVKVMISSSP